jgi:hypothetical protein
VQVGYDAYDQDISPDRFDDNELQAMDASMSFCEPCGTDPTETFFPEVSTTDTSGELAMPTVNLNGRKIPTQRETHIRLNLSDDIKEDPSSTFVYRCTTGVMSFRHFVAPQGLYPETVIKVCNPVCAACMYGKAQATKISKAKRPEATPGSQTRLCIQWMALSPASVVLKWQV